MRAKVFVSYSRKDTVFAEKLTSELSAREYEAFLDRTDILPGEPWQGRVGQLIADSDAVIFIISPDSVTSDVCAWEISEAERLSKRSIPVLVRPTPDALVPRWLARLNFIFFFDDLPASDSPPIFEVAVGKLVLALETDIGWVREHTRLGLLAQRWHALGKPILLLLSGDDLKEATTWLSSAPRGAVHPTPLIREWIGASQSRNDILTAYNAARVSALESYVRPLLLERIQLLRKRNEDLATSGTMRSVSDFSAKEKENEEEIDTINNILNPRGRWHPLEPTIQLNTGARGDYSDVYLFSCCNKYVLTDNRVPSRYRTDGCCDAP